MSNFLGADFDSSVPADSSPRRDGASWIRDTKARLKNFFGVLFDLETGQLKDNVVASAKLAPMSGLAAGEYNLVTVNTKGVATSARNVTTLADLGITDAVSPTDVHDTLHGGTGAETTPANGQIPIGQGTTTALWALPTSTDGSLHVTTGAGSLDVKAVAGNAGSLGNGVSAFSRTVTLTSAAAGTPVDLIEDSELLTASALFVSQIFVQVNGGTAWTGITSVTIRDTNGTPVVFATLPVASLTGSAFLKLGDAGVVLGDAVSKGTGGTVAKGLCVSAEANATAGSSLIVTVFGVAQAP